MTTAAAAFAGALVLGVGTGAAAQDTADDPELTAEQRADLDSRANDALRHSKPDGKRIAPDKIAWDDGAVVLTLAVDGETRDAHPTGTDGHVYLYDGASLDGDSLSFYDCGFHKLRDYNFTNKTSSWFNNQYGNELARLAFWNGEFYPYMDTGWAVYTASFDGEKKKNNRADAVRVCQS